MNESESSISENESGEVVPEAIRKIAKNVSLNLLPDKSKKLYTTAYNAFKKWRSENGSNSFCEDVLLAYFADLARKYAPSSLWATYSMLKCAINTYDCIDLSRYKRLTTFLKKKSLGYRSKKSQVFSKDNISKFLNEAPDDIYLCEKVALIFGISGALRREEFVNITVDDVRKLEDGVLLIKIPKTKNYVPRSFTVTDQLFHYCWKYMQARPESCPINRFFLRYSKGKCAQQAIGINKFASMPRDIAEYLNLPNAKDFTGHSFRRTSATLLVDAGGDLTTLQRHGGWKSATVAFGYIADSINNKKKICDQISSGININKRTETAVSGTASEIDYRPSTSEVITTLESAENQARTPEAAKTSTRQKTHKSRIPIPMTSKPNQGTNVRTSVECTNLRIFNDSFRENSRTTRDCEVQPQEPKLPCFYHPDIGLYFPCITNQDAPMQNCVFNNCNVAIHGSNNTFVFSQCDVEKL